MIDPLPPIDHSAIDYPSFEKNFYEEHSDVVQLQGARLMELRHTLGLKVCVCVCVVYMCVSVCVCSCVCVYVCVCVCACWT